MRKLLFLFLLPCAIQAAAHTGDSTQYLRPQDTIFLSIGQFGEKYFTHYIEDQQTLYSLADFYGLSLQDLYFYNPGLQQRVVKIGMPVNIPVPNRAIKRYWHSGMIPGSYAPVYYTVRRGDTMFRIAKRYFHMPVEEMLQRNGLFDHTLSTGQLLHVGWMDINGIPDSLRRYQGGALGERNAALKHAFQMESMGKRLSEHQGAACWPENQKGQSDLYALHRYAAVNSVISIHNPMSRRTVYARVIGRIPDTAYEDEVITIVSPMAARLLGAIDPRFFVKVKYRR